MARILCDVDGVVADLMGGFGRWLGKVHGIIFFPGHPESLRPSKLIKSLLLDFLRVHDVYMRYVQPIRGAQQAMEEIVSAGHTLRFVTSITEEPAQFAAKDRWLQHHFGHIDFKTCTIPSREKHYHMGDYVIDDRADTIVRFMGCGKRRGLFLFAQPWNFAYDDVGLMSRDLTSFCEGAAVTRDTHCRVMRTDDWDIILDTIFDQERTCS